MVLPLKQAIHQFNQLKELRNKHNPRRHYIGIGKIVGFLIVTGYFIYIPAILKMLWPYILQNFQNSTIYVGGIMCLNIVLTILINSVYYIIYHLKHPFFQQYKNTNNPWPWQQNPQKWRKLRNRNLMLMSINFLVVSPIMFYLSLSTSKRFQYSLEKWPSVFQRILHIAFFAIAQDCSTYFIHKLLHQPGWYSIHKIHHEYKNPVSISALHLHPLDFIMIGSIPFAIGYQILDYFTNIHVTTIFIIPNVRFAFWLYWTWNTLSLFPHALGPDYHQFHHSANDGNLGVMITFWDTLFGTQTPYFNYLRKGIKQKQKSQNLKVKQI